MLFADQPLATLAPGRGIGSVLRIRQMLSAATPKLAESNPLNAALRIRTLVRHRSLIVMLTDVDDATVAGQLASAARLLLPQTFAADRGNLQPRSGGDARCAGAFLARSLPGTGCAGIRLAIGT